MYLFLNLAKILELGITFISNWTDQQINRLVKLTPTKLILTTKEDQKAGILFFSQVNLYLINQWNKLLLFLLLPK